MMMPSFAASSTFQVEAIRSSEGQQWEEPMLFGPSSSMLRVFSMESTPGVP